jgi:hypothetical protein
MRIKVKPIILKQRIERKMKINQSLIKKTRKEVRVKAEKESKKDLKLIRKVRITLEYMGH